jgi:hypothetical protein
MLITIPMKLINRTPKLLSIIPPNLNVFRIVEGLCNCKLENVKTLKYFHNLPRHRDKSDTFPLQTLHISICLVKKLRIIILLHPARKNRCIIFHVKVTIN